MFRPLVSILNLMRSGMANLDNITSTSPGPLERYLTTLLSPMNRQSGGAVSVVLVHAKRKPNLCIILRETGQHCGSVRYKWGPRPGSRMVKICIGGQHVLRTPLLSQQQPDKYKLYKRLIVRAVGTADFDCVIFDRATTKCSPQQTV